MIIYLETKQKVSQVLTWILDGTARLHSKDDQVAPEPANEFERASDIY